MALKLKLALRRATAVDMGCNCRRTKLSSLFSPKPRKHPKPHSQHQYPPIKHSYYHHHSLSPSTTTTITATTISPSDTRRNLSLSSSTTDAASSSSSPPDTTFSHRRRAVKESVAVVKESRDPYRDFQDSMLSMILEKEIYAWDDLRDLLHHFLVLNSPYHHDAILRAFTEIWNGVFASSVPSHTPRSSQRRRQHGKRARGSCPVA